MDGSRYALGNETRRDEPAHERRKEDGGIKSRFKIAYFRWTHKFFTRRKEKKTRQKKEQKTKQNKTNKRIMGMGMGMGTVTGTGTTTGMDMGMTMAWGFGFRNQIDRSKVKVLSFEKTGALWDSSKRTACDGTHAWGGQKARPGARIKMTPMCTTLGQELVVWHDLDAYYTTRIGAENGREADVSTRRSKAERGGGGWEDTQCVHFFTSSDTWIYYKFHFLN
ncbi:hypothetical protein FALCPG4_006578 [Fusarium falciforme]